MKKHQHKLALRYTGMVVAILATGSGACGGIDSSLTPPSEESWLDPSSSGDAHESAAFASEISVAADDSILTLDASPLAEEPSVRTKRTLATQSGTSKSQEKCQGSCSWCSGDSCEWIMCDGLLQNCGWKKGHNRYSGDLSWKDNKCYCVASKSSRECTNKC